MELKDFKNKKITVMGLGLNGGGLGVVNFLLEQKAKVIVTDLKSKDELDYSLNKIKKNKNIKFILGQHRLEDFKNTDMVIKNPAVPENSKYLKVAKENNIPIETEITLFLNLCSAPIIGVTGSKGKSTVVTLLTELLRKEHKNVILAGNIRRSALGQLKKISKKSLVVLELSSWQLSDLKKHKKSPHISVITNILSDHQNRYFGMDDYIEDKKQIFKWQKKDDYLILNYNDEILRDLEKEIKAKVIFYSKFFPDLGFNKIGAFIEDGKIFYKSKENKICSVNQVKVKGDHNLQNILAAVTIAKLYKISNKGIIKTLREFNGVEGRLELVAKINGVEYINDTTATIPEATIAALNSIPKQKDKNIILITGGTDKKLDFEKLIDPIIKKVKILVLLEGSATQKIESKIKKINQDKIPLTIGPFASLEQALFKASSLSKNGDKILLSPASSSFELFKNEFERGEIFKKTVKKIKNETIPT